MNRLLIIPFAVFTSAFFSLKAADDTPDAGAAGVLQLNYVSVITAFRVLSQAEPDYALIVKDVNSRTNTIHLESNAPAYRKVVQFLNQLDQKPTQFKIDSEIVEVTGQGPGSKERVISRPVVYTLAGRPASISFQLDNGKTLRVNLTVSEVEENSNPPAGIPLAR